MIKEFGLIKVACYNWNKQNCSGCTVFHFMNCMYGTTITTWTDYLLNRNKFTEVKDD